MPKSIPQTDLAEITQALEHLKSELKQAKIFLTGGTGFFGIWFIESFLALNQAYDLDAELWILSRNPENFLKRFPELRQHTNLKFATGDVRNFEFPKEQITHVIHAATPANDTLIEREPLDMLSIIIDGTKRVFDFGLSLKQQPKILLTSSGAVYGAQNANLRHMPESAPTSPNLYHRHTAYAVGKCQAEHLTYQYHRLYQLPIKVARCFAFVGPHLPLTAHYAIGNFIADALAKHPITVKATRPVFRSYQYPTDLMIWLWTILTHGESAKPYNVGSDEDLTLPEFAKFIADLSDPPLEVITQTFTTEEASRYVPSVDFAKDKLGLYNRVAIREALTRTLTWHQS